MVFAVSLPADSGSSLLVPLWSLDDLADEHQQMGIPLENYWCEPSCQRSCARHIASPRLSA